MANHFDHHQSRVFQTAGRFFGVDAAWNPSAGGDAIEGRVLFNDPTDKEDIPALGHYERENPKMEWEKGELEGLFEAAQNLNNQEVVTINGIDYQVLQPRKKSDGKTYEANLQVDGEF